MKRIIMFIIVIAAFAGAGVFLYMTFTSTQTPTSVEKPEEVSEILPNGHELDFETVKKFNPTGRKFQSPAVTPAETGLNLGEIMN